MDDENDQTNDTGVTPDEGNGTTTRIEHDYAAELEAANAAVAQRDATIAELNTTLAGKDEEITNWKAANYDLSRRIPADDSSPSGSVDSGEDDLAEPYSELFDN